MSIKASNQLDGLPCRSITHRFGGGHDLLPEPGRTVVEYLDELLGEALEQADGGGGVHVRVPGLVADMGIPYLAHLHARWMHTKSRPERCESTVRLNMISDHQVFSQAC